MKARFNIGDTISNGKVQYTVFGIETNQFGDLCYVFKNPIRDDNFKWVTQEVDKLFELVSTNSDSFDWQSFRNQAAKDILCHLLDKYTGDSDNRGFVTQAIGITNELIKQLREEEEK